MKKIFKTLLFIAAAALTFTSCEREELANTESDSAITLHITANTIDTKTVFGEKADGAYPVKWTEAKKVYFSLNEGDLEEATPVLVNEGANANFEVTLAEGSTSGTIYAFSPKGVYNSSEPTENQGGFTGITANYHDVYLNIPPVQTPLANSCDESAQALVASQTYNGDTEINMTFSHILAYGKMTIKDFAGDDIESVDIVFPENVVGNSCYYYYAGERVGSIDNLKSNTITLNPANVANNVFWFALAPTAGNTGEMKIIVTDSDEDTYTKTINLSAHALPFNAGKVSSFTASFSGIEADEEEEEWEFVETDYELASSIEAGDEVIIASATTDGKAWAMKKYESGNNWKSIQVNVVDGVISSTEDMAIITLKDAGTDGVFYMYDNNCGLYLDATATTSNNYLIASKSTDKNNKFSIAIDSSNKATIKNTQKTSRNILKFNNSTAGNELFSCYSSGQKDVYVYKKAAPSVLLSIAISRVAREYFYVNEEFDYSGLTVTATYTNGKQSNVTGFSVSTPDMTTAGEKTVTVTYTENNVTKTADYTITVLELPILQSIELSGSYKTSFMQDEGFNTSGLVVTAKYQNGQSRDLSEREYSVSDIDTHNPGEQTVTISYTEDEVTATASYTITITERPVYTVTFAVEGIVDIVLPVYEIITLPVVENVPSPYSFVGWVESVLETETQQEPSNILSGQYTITKNVTLYPVYSKTVSSGVVWRKLEQFDGEGTYVIITNDGTKAFNGNISSGHGQSTGTFSFVNGVATSAPDGALELTATAKGDGYELYNAGKGYLYAKKAGSGSLAFQATTSDDCYWYFSTKYDQRNMLYKANDARLRSYENTTFRTYGANNGAELYLAKKEAGESTIYTSSLSSE